MDDKFLIRTMKYLLMQDKTCNATVQGNSMLPELRQDDIVSITSDEIIVGDILVFEYNTKIIIHRLLKVIRNNFLCKGDNSFSIECINKSQIIGKVKSFVRNGFTYKIRECTQEQINLSYLVYKEFVKSKYDVKKTIATSLYKEYKLKYLITES